MGTVYRARDRRTDGPVAVKLLSMHGPDTTPRFEREIRALASLRHENIIAYVDHGATEDGEPYLAMEWVEGEDLADRLDRGRLSVASALALAAAAGRALGFAHKQGIVHRDLKPGNLVLPGGDVGRVKLLDFGIARVADATVALTGSGTTVGTPAYMAPEQARGEGMIDARADVFSLGCVLFECLTGRPPFVAAHPIAVLAKVLFEVPPPPSKLRPGLSPAVDALVLRMLSKDPALRPADGIAAAEEIEALGTEVLSEDELPSAPRPALTTHERRLVCVVLAANEEDAGGAVGAVDALGAGGLVGQARAAPALQVSGAADRASGAGAPMRGMATTMAAAPAPLPTAALQKLADRHSARLEILSGGSVVAILAAPEPPTDLAARAARCARAVRALLPRASVVLATGWDVLDGAQPVGHIIDRAGALLDRTDDRVLTPPAGGLVRICPMTLELLGGRFEVEVDERGPLLGVERDPSAGARKLLGKPTPCLGRERELSELMRLFEECGEESAPRVALVLGPAGIGKTRLRVELLRRLREHSERASVWVARGDPMSAGSPFGLLAQVVRRAAGVESGDSAVERASKLDARVKRRVPPARAALVAEFLSELAGVTALAEPSLQLTHARKNPLLMGDQMRRAWEDFLCAECAEGPVVLVLEDLHWGDLPTLKFIDAALRNLEGSPLFVLGFARPELEDLFPDIWKEHALFRIRLGALTRRACERLIQEVLGDKLSGERVARIVERSGGNAFFLEELIRAEAAGQRELPETVIAMVQVRVEALPEPERRVLRAASVFGDAFTPGGVAALLGQGGASLQIDALFADLTERELIAPRGAAGAAAPGEHAFRHAIVREAAYAMLTVRDRELGHRLAGEWLERAGGSDAVVLAEHFERGRAPERAMIWYMRAAEQALEGGDLSVVHERVHLATVCGASGEALGALLSLSAYAHEWQGQFVDAERSALQAIELLPRGSAPWFEAARQALMAAGRLGDEAVLGLVSDAILASGAAAQGASAMGALTEAVMRFSIAGRTDWAEPLHARVEAFARASETIDPKVLARINQARAYRSYLLQGDIETYLARTAEAAASYEQAGDLRNAYYAGGDLGYAQLEIGAYAEATATLCRVLEGADRMGLSGVTAVARKNLGMALARLGALDEAVEIEGEAITAFVAQHDRRMEGGARIYLAIIRLLRGESQAALNEARAAVEVLAASPPLRIYALAVLASANLACGLVPRALTAIRNLVAYRSERGVSLEALGDSAEGESYIRLAHVEVLYASGQDDAAKEALQAARRRLLARAHKIKNPEWRAGFLGRVPHNERTLVLARERLGDEPT
jgi:tetratricopeptide (TPR) repeat protein